MTNIVTFTGPSGSGKGYVKKAIKANLGLIEIPVYTTRQLRENEDSTDRISIDSAAFAAMLAKHQLCLTNYLYGNYYGFNTKDIDRLRDGGRYVLELYADNVPIFHLMFQEADMIAVLPDSLCLLESRLRKREENMDSMAARIKNAEYELNKIKAYTGYFSLLCPVSQCNESSVLDDIMVHVEKSMGVGRCS